MLAVAAAGCQSPGSSSISEAHADERPTPAAGGVAVVELFTSEGCSSCPPADGVLAELSRSAKESGRSVYAIAFHVDYWDSLGWPDRFASPDYTARQRTYGRALGKGGLYTPQMVVEGLDEFIGSDRARASRSVARALERPATATVSIRASRRGADAVAVDYEVKDAPPTASVSFVVVDPSASVAVQSGENAGATLHHTDIARALATVSLVHPSGTQVLRVPPDASRDGAVIAFVQEPPTDGAGAPITGATRSAIVP